MKKFRVLTIFFVILAMLVFNIQPALAAPPLPSGFKGTVKIDGANVPAGTAVSARINGVEYAASSYLMYNGDTVYSLDVLGDDPDSPSIIEGGVDGNTIVFFIGAIQATQTGTWHSGINVVLDLTGFSPRALTISKSGAGSGTVTSSPSGIDCGSTCLFSFNYNTPVTLAASAATGSAFSGWSGACTNTSGTCAVTMDAAKAVTANFILNNPVPTTTSLSPTSATAGSAAFTLTVNGTNFVNGSIVRWGGANRTTAYVSSTQLTASITAADITAAGTASVTVFNPTPGGGTSGAQTFTINNPVPTTTSLSPTSATAGSAAFTLTVNGTNFKNSSIVRWGGANRTTTYVSATQLTASITAADIAAAGTASVTVFNPTPGGGTSGALTFTINNPVPTTTSLSPASATVGGAAFTLTVNGTNFINGSIVRWGGTDRTTTYVSSTQLTASISAADIAAAGTANVTVFNPTPGGGTSGAQTFTISTASIYTLSVSKSGAGSGTITSSPIGIDCGSTCSAGFTANTNVILTAASATGSTFTSWSGAGCMGTGTCTVTMDAAKSVIATFTQIEYTLTLNKVGSGTLSANPNNATYHYGDVVALTATPAAGWSFGSWSANVTGGSVTINGNTTVTATFIQVQANLGITHGSIPTVLNPGATWTIIITATNAGPAEATDVTVIDILPTGVTFVSASGSGWTCNKSSSIVTCTRLSLAVSASAEISLVIKVPLTAGKITNTVVIASELVDPENANNTSTGETTVVAIPVTGLRFYIPVVANNP